MGAAWFTAIGTGKTAKEAFIHAVENARWEHGHGGYTGTVAEKGEFVELRMPAGWSTAAFLTEVQRALPHAEYDEQTGKWVDKGGSNVPEVARAAKVVDDKWGPAGAVKRPDGGWLFFGMASS